MVDGKLADNCTITNYRSYGSPGHWPTLVLLLKSKFIHQKVSIDEILRQMLFKVLNMLKMGEIGKPVGNPLYEVIFPAI